MRFTIEAACGCSTGRVRKNNEDNFCFDDNCLERENDGLKEPMTVERTLKTGFCVAVFDGMGGENFGEHASYAAARQMRQAKRSLADFFVPTEKYLNELTVQLNDAVLKAQQEMCTERMGSTMVFFYFGNRHIYSCNVGDSRAYQFRDGRLLQLSRDHVEHRPGKEHRKAPLTQYLGIDPEEIQNEPHIAKDELRKGDLYLLCSDGLTDMLTDGEIANILQTGNDTKTMVQNFVQTALEHGGRDNITVIVCKLK